MIRMKNYMFKPNSTQRVWTTVYCMCICPKWTTNSTRTVYEQYTVPAQQHTVQEPTAHCWVLCLARNSNSIRTVYCSNTTAHCSNINSTLFMPLAVAKINSIRTVHEQYTVPQEQRTVYLLTAYCLPVCHWSKHNSSRTVWGTVHCSSKGQKTGKTASALNAL